ncbi:MULTISPECIES: DUF952 domain-containing protein [Bacillaceae]|uniref:DUF952 domain-containing protein n=1 Tax=Evansella alkalicola TaxID=745819 RepID=A0ABS6JPA5_9BACI|nr:MULTISPECIES: DUF952 domain-containing protein [Bacillaceae]MBU9719926.1 DUF952 domain-containing protein [Bacillus alkalicola]
MIYHLLSMKEWERAKGEGVYWPEELDKKGYIHCLTEEQLHSEGDTVLLKEEGDIILLKIYSHELESLVVLEDTTESGKLYPHVYGHINLNAIKEVSVYKGIGAIQKLS